MLAKPTIAAGVLSDRLSEQHAVLTETRERTLELVSELGEADLSRVVDPLLSPLLWDLGHIANFEQRWLLGDEDGRLDSIYNPFAQPRAKRGGLPFLHSDDCRDYMGAVRDRVNEDFDGLDPYLVELVIQHEQQHNETMLQLLRMLDGYVPPAGLRNDFRPTPRGGGARSWVSFPAGDYRIGAGSANHDDFVYDNELAPHVVSLAEFAIASHPVSNGEYREWIENGGYVRRDWWSDAGWGWLQEHRVSAPLSWRLDGAEVFEHGFGGARRLNHDAPVCHVNWFEADAYARAHEARLPSEFEWEAAASYDPGVGAAGRPRRRAWGDERWTPGAANLDQLAFGTVATGADHGFGLTDMNGQVWQWTSTEFAAYPGFEPFCYREYSAPFFDAGYRVLRGGSWATRARTVDNRFRNWDHPQRRQIFSGIRLAI